jgi:hypothetical protein
MVIINHIDHINGVSGFKIYKADHGIFIKDKNTISSFIIEQTSVLF